MSIKKAKAVSEFKLIFFCCCNFVTVNASAQIFHEECFPKYSYYLSEVFDMTWKQPQNFIWEKIETNTWTEGRIGRRSVYVGSMQSKDGNCLILYPECISVMFNSLGNPDYPEGDPIFAQRQLVYDMREALDKDFSIDSIPADLGQYIVTLVGRKALFKADTVFVVQIPLKMPYREKYTYCTGVYACKHGRPSITFKCFFTDKGKANDKKYLAEFYKTIEYRRNRKWRYDHEKSLRTIYKIGYMKIEK